MPRRDGADNEGGAGPRDQVWNRMDATQGVIIIQEVGGDGFGGRIGRIVGGGVVIIISKRVGTDFIEIHWRDLSGSS